MPVALALILVAAAIQSVAWDVALPAFQGPDESAHFGYVQHLAETGSPPSSTKGGSPNSLEVAEALNTLNLSSLIGNLGARPAWSAADLALWHKAERSLPAGSRANGNGPNPIAQNPPLYYALMAIPYRVFVWLPLLKRLFVLRLFNALCYLATIALTWLLAGELFGRVRWKQALAAGTVALEPQLAFMSAVINADNLLIAMTTAFLLAAVRLVTRGPSLRRVLAAAVLSGLAALTHGRGLITVPVLCVALLVALIRYRPPLGTALRRGALAGSVVLVALLIDLAVERANGGGTVYGGQVKSLNSDLFNLRHFLSFIYQFFFPRLKSLGPRIGPSYGYRQVFIDTFYGTFGSLEVAFPSWVYDTLQVLSALGLVALYTACVVRVHTAAAPPDTGRGDGVDGRLPGRLPAVRLLPGAARRRRVGPTDRGPIPAAHGVAVRGRHRLHRWFPAAAGGPDRGHRHPHHRAGAVPRRPRHHRGEVLCLGGGDLPGRVWPLAARR